MARCVQRRVGHDRRRDWVELSTYERMREWCRGRIWWWRVPIVVWLAIAAIHYAFDFGDWAYITFINTLMHNLGHLIWGWWGYPISMYGGPFTQCLVPFLAFQFFNHRGDYFWETIALAWLSTNLIYIAQFTTVGDPAIFPYGLLGATDVGDECADFVSDLSAIGMSHHIARGVYWFGLAALALMIGTVINQIAFMIILEQNRRRAERRFREVILGESEA